MTHIIDKYAALVADLRSDGANERQSRREARAEIGKLLDDAANAIETLCLKYEAMHDARDDLADALIRAERGEPID